MVIQPGERNVNDPIARAPHLQAKIHIAESDGQPLFIKSPHLLEDFAPRQKTRTGNRAVVARRLELSRNARRLRGQTAKRMPGDSANANHDARVLDRIVGKQQPRANRSNLGTLHMLSHHRQPIALDRFGIIVQKEEPRAVGLGHGEVVDGGIVERAAITQEPVLELGEIGARFLGLAVVIDDGCFRIEAQPVRQSFAAGQRGAVAQCIEIFLVSVRSCLTQ